MDFPIIAENNNLVVEVITVKQKVVNNFEIATSNSPLQYVKVVDKGDTVKCRANIDDIIVIENDVTNFSFLFENKKYILISSSDIRCYIPSDKFDDFINNVI